MPSLLSCLSLYTATLPSFLYPFSLHDALPIYAIDENPFFAPNRHIIGELEAFMDKLRKEGDSIGARIEVVAQQVRSEEHTSELQSRGHLVCRLLPDKKD